MVRNLFHLSAISLIVITLLLRFDLIFTYSHDTGYGGFMLHCIYGIQSLMQNGQLYFHPEQVPYALIQYTPIYYYVCVGLAHLFHVLPTDVFELIVLSKILCLCCNFLSAYIFSLWLKNHFKVPKLISWVGGGLTLLFLTSHFYTRVDSLFLLFWISTIYCLFKYIHQPSVILLWIMATISVLNFFVKQNALSTIGFVVLCLYLLGSKKMAFYFLLQTSLLGIVCLAFMMLNENLYFFYLNIFKGLKNGTNLDFISFLKRNTLFWLFFLAFCFEIVRRFRQQKLFRSPIEWAIVFFGIEAGFSFFKVGSSVNYLVPVELLIFGLFIGNVWGANAIQKGVKTFHFWAIVFIILSAFYENTMLLYQDLQFKKLYFDNYFSQKELANYLEKQLENEESKKVLFLDHHNYLSNFLIKRIVFPTLSPTYQCYAADPKLFDYRSFENQLKRGDIKFVVAPSTQPPPFVFLGYNLTSYVEDKKMGRYNVYKLQKQ